MRAEATQSFLNTRGGIEMNSRNAARVQARTGPMVHIVDDDESIREALSSLFRAAGMAVRSYDRAQAFLDAPHTDTPGCLILDIRLPGLSGLDLQRQMADRAMEVPIIFISCHADIPITVQGMKAGAVEFLTKPFSDGQLLEAVEQAVERNRVFRRETAERAVLHVRFNTLTPREKEVMEHVVAGLLNKQIAGELGTSEVTIKLHRGRVMHKMAAGSLAELVRMAQKVIPMSDSAS
jgi:FixJ family two-component response regulator